MNSENHSNNTETNHLDDSIKLNPLNNVEEDKQVRYVKLTNKSCIHNKCKFKEGLNVDILPFIEHKMCGSRGLYFCKYKDLGKWTIYND